MVSHKASHIFCELVLLSLITINIGCDAWLFSHWKNDPNEEMEEENFCKNVLDDILNSESDDYDDERMRCAFQRENCLRDCQRGEKAGLSTCSIIGVYSAPFAEQFGAFYESVRDSYLDNAVIASIEGIFWSLSGYCGSNAVEICKHCRSFITYENILKIMNKTNNVLKEREETLMHLNRDFQDMAELLVKDIPNQHEVDLVRIRKYEDVLHQTDQILYWFTQKDKSRLFRRLFQQKIDGSQGGLEWISWSLDAMVRDLVSNEPDIYCRYTLYYSHLQIRVSQVAAFLAAEEGTLYEFNDHGTIVLGKNTTQIIEEQRAFISQHCHKH